MCQLCYNFCSNLCKRNVQGVILYSGKQYSISTTAGWSPFSSRFKTWLFVNPIVEMQSIWWIRSPGARKSAAGPSVFSALIMGGYDKSKRSTNFTWKWKKWKEKKERKHQIKYASLKNQRPRLFLSQFLCIRQHFKHNNLMRRWMEWVRFSAWDFNLDASFTLHSFSFRSKVLHKFIAISSKCIRGTVSKAANNVNYD